MKFSFSIPNVLPLDDDGFITLDAANYKVQSHVINTPLYFQPYTKTKADPAKEYLTEILDRIGAASSKVFSYKTYVIPLRHKDLNKLLRIIQSLLQAATIGFI